nr:unnamed protein product [Callosobruchus chinensis]
MPRTCCVPGYKSNYSSTLNSGVDKNMVIKVYLGGKELTYNDLKWTLPFDFKLSRWYQLENLLTRYKEVSCIVDNSFNFLVEKCLPTKNSLKKHEKIVVLLVNEIYVNKRLGYRGKNIVGLGSNDNSLATKVPLEMVPVTKNVISLVQKCDFTDLDRINSSMFPNLKNNLTFFPNPDLPGCKIFTRSDFVHIFKNIINNWKNLKNLEYLSFDNFSYIKYAKFQHIKEL